MQFWINGVWMGTGSRPVPQRLLSLQGEQGKPFGESRAGEWLLRDVLELRGHSQEFIDEAINRMCPEFRDDVANCPRSQTGVHLEQEVIRLEKLMEKWVPGGAFQNRLKRLFPRVRAA